MYELINDWKLIILGCLTIGLAPFFPEPHIIGKLRWLFGGARGMQTMDWFDLLLHGLPWLLLARFIIVKSFNIKTKYEKESVFQRSDTK